LPRGATVLDLCCGMGRHAMALADCGYNVTGVDLSDSLLAEAQKRDTEGRVCWLRGDMRNIPVDGPFDCVVNLFTSFGYFDSDAENAKVIAEISRVLKPGGRWIIDFLNVPYVQAHLVAHSVRQDANRTIDEKRSIHNGIIYKRISISEPGKPKREYAEQVKGYSLEQFRRMTDVVQLRIDAVYGGYDGAVYDELISPRLILTGTKEGMLQL
jgi:ubiquinone/menaquinone biosynthesis C-methylase UbiE